jgi:hypothetical protein
MKSGRGLALFLDLGVATGLPRSAAISNVRKILRTIRSLAGKSWLMLAVALNQVKVGAAEMI